MVVAILGACALILTGCLSGPMSSLDAHGHFARSANRLFEDVFVIVVIIFVLVEGAIVWFLIKYREKPGDPLPVQIHGHTRAEVVWTVIPALILAGVAIPTVKMIFDFAAVPPAATRIDACVTGHQWWWEYQYMKTNSDACPHTGNVDPTTVSVTTANELHIPINTPVYLTLQSIDVIHSFWVPQLNGKQDLVPGHSNHITIEADTPGVYLGQCSQYCGLSHANMRLRVIAETRSDYDAWLAGQEQPGTVPADPTAAAGMQLFLNGRNGTGYFANKSDPACSGCHTIDGLTVNGVQALGTKGPNLTHLESRLYFAGDTFQLTDANLKSWLKDPPAMKPGVDMPDLGLTQTEITELIAYLDTLK
ncbi:MAG TPA: cytochrome c oxidase subunit II [Actinomycetota bacterium]|nr:cytochrome c oxidase subunit II [Actinomycetota bacterium]